MKTRITLAALAILAVGCTQNETVETPDILVNAKAIRVGQSVQGLTRAVVTSGSTVTATVLMCDGASADWNNFKAERLNVITDGALKTRANISTASFTAGATAAMTFNQTLYYTSESGSSTTKSHLVAVAPSGAVGNSGTTVTMATVDGQQDVMHAASVDAGSESSMVTPDFTFNHLTTQLNFAVKMTAATSNGEWSNKTVTVKKINIQSAQLPQSVNAADGVVTWTQAAGLLVPNMTTTGLSVDALNTGNPVMIHASGEVKVDVTLAVDGQELVFSNVTIKNASGGGNLTTVAGSAHKITLDVKEPTTPSAGNAIAATATVTAWKDGAAGSADLN